MGELKPCPVTQVDREAAARIHQMFRDHDMHRWINDGKADADSIVQAFVRHRLAERAAVLAEVERHLAAVQYDPAPYTAMKARLAALKNPT